MVKTDRERDRGRERGGGGWEPETDRQRAGKLHHLKSK